MERDDYEAVKHRLDTRCVRWPYYSQGEPERCGKCSGCKAKRWLDAQVIVG